MDLSCRSQKESHIGQTLEVIYLPGVLLRICPILGKLGIYPKGATGWRAVSLGHAIWGLGFRAPVYRKSTVRVYGLGSVAPGLWQQMLEALILMGSFQIQFSLLSTSC